VHTSVRVGVVSAKDLQARRVAEAAIRFLRLQRPEVSIRSDPAASGSDLLVLSGDDRFFLDALHGIDSGPEVLLVGEGFLSEAAPENVEGVLETIFNGRHWVETRLRLEVTAGTERLPTALNEVALSAKRGAGFLRYTLEVDGDRLWRDGGDGIVICTPTGSTGYGLSAGGPIVMEKADALVAVPVCSASGQRPLVVPSKSVLAVTEIESRLGCELILDGTLRARVDKSGFRVQVSSQPIRFVRLEKAKFLRVFGKLRAKRAGQEPPVGASPSAKYVFRLLSDQGPMTEKQLVTESGLPERTVRNALTYLVRQKYVRRSSSLRDARQAIFAAGG
jgi:NAD+ kinase